MATCTRDNGWTQPCDPPPGYPASYHPEGWKFYADCQGGCQVPICKFDCVNTPPPDKSNSCQKWECSETRGYYLVNLTRGSPCHPWTMTAEGQCETKDYQGNLLPEPDCQYKCNVDRICGATAPPNTSANTPDDYYYCQNVNELCYTCANGYGIINGACLQLCNDPAQQYHCVRDITENMGVSNTHFCYFNKACIYCRDNTIFNTTTDRCEATACTTDGCTAGTYRCSGSSVQICNQKNPTCTKWETTSDCASRGQSCVVINSFAQCVSCIPSNNGVEICDNQDNNCDGRIDEPVAGLCPGTQVCTNGACITPCIPSTEVCDGVDNNCNDQIDENPTTICASGLACYAGNCDRYTITITDAQGNPMGETAQVPLGDTLYLAKRYTDPAGAPARTLLTINDHQESSDPSALYPVSGASIPQTQTFTFKAFVNSNVVATDTITINTICNPGMQCYCKQECLATSDPNLNKTAGYCASGTCGTCKAGTYASAGRCVQCIENTQCVNTSKSNGCYTALCINNACVFTDIPTGTACGNNQFCEAGKCVGCTVKPNSCIPSLRNVTVNTSIEACKVQVETFEITTASICTADGASNVCKTGTETNRSVDTNIVNRPNGYACGTHLACLSGKCVNELCVDTTIGYGKVDWIGNHSICNGIVNLTDCTYTYPVPADTTCKKNEPGDGYCTGEDTCTLKCPSLLPDFRNDTPGCRDGIVNFAQVLADRACPGGQLCYECNPDYHFDGSNCVASTYTLDFSTTPLVARTSIIITPELYNKDTKRTETNDGHKFTFLFTLSKTEDFLTTHTIRVEEPGEYAVTLTALDTTGKVVASTSRTLSISCPADNLCCPANSNAYLPDNSICTDGERSGICKDKVCLLGCIPTGNEVCSNGKDDDCNGKIDCQDAACTDSCSGLNCRPGEMVCNRACTNIQTSNLNCGECDNRCRSNEQCQQGTCIEVPNCDIICNTDEECGRGMMCINPGSCDNSYCAPATAVVTNETAVKSIMERYTKTFKITQEIDGDELRISIINLAPVPLRNFTLTANIPKEVAPTASSLGASERFSVIQEDPVIAFNFAVINAHQEIVIDLPAQTDAAYAQSVQITGSHNPLSDMPIILTDEVTITSNLLKDGNRSKLLLGLNPHAELYGVRVPVEIPKCIATSAKQLQLSGNYEIIEDDPLVVWTFDELTSKETIEISIDGDVTENCKNSLTAFAVADLVDQPINPWIPLLLIPVIGVILVTFSRFHGGGAKERLTKKEFAALAKEQGRSDQEIEESWREYERKF